MDSETCPLGLHLTLCGTFFLLSSRIQQNWLHFMPALIAQKTSTHLFIIMPSSWDWSPAAWQFLRSACLEVHPDSIIFYLIGLYLHQDARDIPYKVAMGIKWDNSHTSQCLAHGQSLINIRYFAQKKFYFLEYDFKTWR